MTEEVVTANQVPPKVERSARAVKGTSQLFITIAFSFFGGVHFANGMRHLRVAGNEHDWVSDFFFSIVWLTLATIAGVRTIKATGPTST